MRAAVFKGVGQSLAIERSADPTPGDGQIVIKVGRCGICASDLHFTDGRSEKYLYSPGTVPGHEVAGEIVAIGTGVTRVKVGDPVASMPFAGCGDCDFCRAGRQIFCPNWRRGSGGYAEYVLHHENAVVRLPSTLSMADGALVEPFAVALRGVSLARMPTGASVLIFGAGPMGLATAYWARRHGASRIAVVARSRRREELAMIMGADHFLSLDDLPPLGASVAGAEADSFVPAGNQPTGLAAVAVAALGGLPEIVFDCVGDPGSMSQAIGCVRPTGTVVVVGFCLEPDTFVPADAASKEVRIQFSAVYDTAEFEHAARMLDLGSTGPSSMITGVVGLDGLPAQFEALRGSTHHCKVMIDPWK